VSPDDPAPELDAAPLPLLPAPLEPELLESPLDEPAMRPSPASLVPHPAQRAVTKRATVRFWQNVMEWGATIPVTRLRNVSAGLVRVHDRPSHGPLEFRRDPVVIGEFALTFAGSSRSTPRRFSRSFFH
jgi:hypothetical protein